MSVLEVRSLGKAYRQYGSELHRMLSWFGLQVKPLEEHWVLRNISFSIAAGESIGIVGQNGAGKSTLLKLITGTQSSTQGKVHVNGRIAAILELGMGFNSEFTGRQNAYHGLGMMGFSHVEIERVMPELEAFVEIGEYFDQPVRTYSTGMQMRVAFAVVTAFHPEILIIDEALSVGDTYFQHKSFNRIREFQKQGTTLLIVSHDPGAIKLLCNRAILLDEGLVVKDGKPEEVMDFYNALIAQKENTTIVQQAIGDRFETTSGTGQVIFSDIKLYNANKEPVKIVKVGEAVELDFTVVANQSVDSLVLGCGITNRLGQMMFGTNTWHTKQVVHNVKAGDVYRYKVAFLANLGIGSYAVHCSLAETDSHLHKNFEWRDGTLIFEVVNVDKEIFVGCMWNEMNFSIEKVAG